MGGRRSGLLVRISGLVRIGISSTWASMLGSVSISSRGLLWSRSWGVLCHALMAIGRLRLRKLRSKRSGITISAILLASSPLRLRMVGRGRLV